MIGPQKLFEWCLEKIKLPEWLVMESYAAVGDLAETITLLIAKKKYSHEKTSKLSLSEWLNKRILPLQDLNTDQQKVKIFQYWKELDQPGIFVFNKILTGSLRIGVSELLTIQGLSLTLNIPKETLSQKLMGNWQPTAEFFLSLKAPLDPSVINLNPYPFYLASPIDMTLESLGNINEWIAEWKWDGIRAQCINREGRLAIWSRGNELISHQFPEIMEAISKIPSGTVLDGEILAFRDKTPLPFGELQKRLGRKKVSKTLIESVPIVFMIYDILEQNNCDIRKKPFSERRAIFENWKLDQKLHISPKVHFHSWEELKLKRIEATTNGTEGLILKRVDSPYLTGRRRGNWWKYKIDPKTIDAVLIYAQPGHGWRANLYTDYTFGVWHEGELVPIAKAYSGLSKEEIMQLDKWIRKNTMEKFGPARKVKAEQVFEIAFEGIQKSNRHKSGIAFRFPRILRWRIDKPPEECDSLEQVKSEFLKGDLNG